MPIQESIHVPYDLIPTTMDGVFLSPPPRADFDPQTASSTALIKNGFLWRRPEEDGDPAHRAAWKRAFSRTWQAEDRLIPEFEPQPGRTHYLRSAERADDGSYTGAQWAGAVVRGTWTGAVGYWAIPAVGASPEPQGTEGGWNSSSWVGIDGTFGSNDVLQAGIEQRVDGNGNPSYVAWYEWYAPSQSGSPAYIYQVNIPNFLVSPGQTVFCSVQYVGTTAGQVSFANETTGQYFSITLAPPPGATFSGNAAEWIMEAPDGGLPKSSLPIFTPVVFTTALCYGPNNTKGDPSGGDIFNITGFGTTLTSVTLGQTAATIDYAGPRPTGPLFGLTPNRQAVYEYNGGGTSWTPVGGPAATLYGGGYGLVATNPSNGNVFRYLGTPNNWVQIGGPGAAFVVGSSTVYGLTPNLQAVWEYTGSGLAWTQVGGPASQIASAPPGE